MELVGDQPEADVGWKGGTVQPCDDVAAVVAVVDGSLLLQEVMRDAKIASGRVVIGFTRSFFRIARSFTQKSAVSQLA